MARPETMEEYIVNELDGQWATIKCPRSNCLTTFRVQRKKFKQGQSNKCCPYCNQASYVPGRSPSG